MVQLDWLEVIDIAIELNEKYPDLDPQWISLSLIHI